MQDLIKQEIFELEVLELLNTKRLLDNLTFGGGTMLRLCCGLGRYSVDLDFWVLKKIKDNELFSAISECLKSKYILKDSAIKFNTLLFEVKTSEYPRALKIEIRKSKEVNKFDKSIAYSKYSNIQVLLNTVPLDYVMKSKIDAFISRKEIRDVFDIEFLYKKGIKLDVSREKLKKTLKYIDLFKDTDYSSKLGSLLEKNMRDYYKKEKFKIIRSAIKEIIG